METEPAASPDPVAEPDWLNDTEQLAWRAMLEMYLRLFPEIERGLRRFDLLQVEYGVLVALSESSEECCQLSDLADRADISPSRLSHRLATMEERGDIERRTSEEDGRVVYATLTDAGRQRLETVAPHHVADVRRLVFDHLDDAQTAAYADALTSIVEGLGGSAFVAPAPSGCTSDPGLDGNDAPRP